MVGVEDRFCVSAFDELVVLLVLAVSERSAPQPSIVIVTNAQTQ